MEVTDRQKRITAVLLLLGVLISFGSIFLFVGESLAYPPGMSFPGASGSSGMSGLWELFNKVDPYACAGVRIEIVQEMTLERQAFDAHMRINNGLPGIALENISVEVTFFDEGGNVVRATSDPEDKGALFFFRLDSTENVTGTDGTGTINPEAQADIHWLIIPAAGASNGLLQGTLYYIGAILKYTAAGEEEIIEVTPDYVFVKPMPMLILDYFLPGDVYGDDPFTLGIESPIPFPLGVRVKNNGPGMARNLKIESAQPKIVNNEQDLLIDFAIQGSRVNGQEATKDLLITFGDIELESAKVGEWIMTAALNGKFTEFEATYSHADELGGEVTSLLEAVNTHTLIHPVLVDVAGRDAISDFLAQDVDVYRVYESDNVDTVVRDQSAFSSLTEKTTSGDKAAYSLSTPETSGFMYVRLPDPNNGQRELLEVIRSDGKVLRRENAWLSRVVGNTSKHYVNIFDVNSQGSYELAFGSETKHEGGLALQFIPDRSRAEGRQISFIVEATDPTGVHPLLSASPLPAGAGFGPGLELSGYSTGVFDWTPAAGQSGTYSITFSATNGRETVSRRAVLTIYSQTDKDGDGMPDSWEMAHFHTLSRNGTNDLDADGLSDIDEFRSDLDPNSADGPPVPQISRPADREEVASFLPALTIKKQESDSGFLTYTFELYADSGFTRLVATGANISQGTAGASWSAPQVLEENSWYYWRVRSSDGKLFSPWAYGCFFVNTQNDPPKSPSINGPADGVEVNNKRPSLQITNSTDPDNDDLNYSIKVFSDNLSNDPIASVSDINPGTDGALAWRVDEFLSDSHRYYWKATVTDEHGLEAETPLVSFVTDFTGTAPEKPAISYPEPASETAVQALDLVVSNIADPDGTSLFYFFEIDKLKTFDSSSKVSSSGIPEGPGTTSWHVSGLYDDTLYYWRVKVCAGASDSAWTEGTFFVNSANDRPPVPLVKNPGRGAWVDTLTPELETFAAEDSDRDVVRYQFEVYSDPSLTTLIAFGLSDCPKWVVPALGNARWYYWRVRAQDEHGATSAWTPSCPLFVLDNRVDDPPSIFLIEPSRRIVTNEPEVSLTWEDADPDSNARIALYCDRDDSGENGTLIAQGIEEDPDGSGDSYLWDITGLAEGTYCIYALIADDKRTGGNYALGSIVIDRSPPVVTASPDGGEYFDAQDVNLNADENAEIYYTLDGTDPTVDSLPYRLPIRVNGDISLKFMAVDTLGHQSAVRSVAYAIADTDADGMSDDWEIAHFGNLFRDGTSDYDQDGVIDLDEYDQQLDPKNPDTDDDGVIDALDICPGTPSGLTVDLHGCPLLQNPANLTATPYCGYVVLNWSEIELDEYVKEYAVYVSRTDYSTVEGMTPVRTVSEASAAIAGLETGVDYYFAVTAVNPAGTEKKEVTTVRATPVPDTFGPESSGVKLDGENLTDGYVLHDSGTLSIEGRDPAGISRVEFYIDNALYLADANGSLTYSCFWNIAALPDGDHALTIRAYDTLGNSSVLDYSTRVALDPPDAPVVSDPLSGTVTNQSTVTVKGSAERHSGIILYNNGEETGSITADADGNFSFAVRLVEGENHVQAAARNRAGMGPLSGEILVVYDKTIPKAPVRLKGEMRAGGVVTLSWTPGEQTVLKGFNIYRSVSPFTSAAEAAKINSGAVAAFAFEDIPPRDGLYCYRVTSVSMAGTESDMSEMISSRSDSSMPRALSVEYAATGPFDPATGRTGPGKIDIRVTVSEPLQVTPFFSITPEGGTPFLINLVKDSDTLYSGSFTITAGTPSGRAYALFSGRDLAGNRGTEVDSGGSLLIDASGPAVISLDIQPEDPVKNSHADPVSVKVILGLNETAKTGTVPELACILGGEGRSPLPVALTQIEAGPGQAQAWQGTFSFPSDAGLTGTESFEFAYRGLDDFDTPGQSILCRNRFQVYQGSLPALTTPETLTAQSLPGGKIKVAWRAVDGAMAYQLYRQAPGDSMLSEYKKLVGVLEYTDAPRPDGIYRYAIAAVREVNGEHSISGMSGPVEAVSDSIPPERPQNLTLRLTGLGAKASWEAPSGTETLTYALYRSELPEILSVTDLTPAAKDISGTSAVDAAPSCRFHTYAVIAVDGVGNESLPSPSVYLDFSILPVSDLSIFRKGTNPPEISWTYPDGNIAGCDLYIGTGSEMLKVHRSVLSELSYIDTGYSGGERPYTIVTFDDYGREGPARSITLPLLRATLAQGEVRRGLMNRLDFIIENHSSFRAEHVRLKLDISGHNYESQEFSVEGGGTNEVSLVVGGHKDLPQSAILSSFIEITPHDGEKIQIVEENEIEVKEGVPALEVHNEPFVRGGQGRVWFTLENTGDEEIQVIVAEGEEPSPEVSVTLLDPEGNVLSAAPFRQDTGDGLEALSDRTVIVARIPGRKVFTFAPVDLHIPSSVPKDILIQPEISQIHYHLGEADHVAIEGVSTRRQISLVDTSYYGEVLSVTPVSSNGNQDITITGRAGQRGTGTPLPGVELNLIITSSRGFERVYKLLTGSNGLFSFPFRPCDGDYGRFSVCAMHPDLLDRPVHGEFVINRMHIDPAVIKLNLAKNYQRTMNVRIDAGQETAAHNVRLEYAREDQPDGLFPVGVFVAPGAAIAEIRPDEKGLLNFNIWADSRAQKAAKIILKLMSDESGEEACGFVIIDGCFEDAVPKLYSTPDYVETGMGFGDTVMEKVVLENRGPAALHGVSLDLVLPDGGPAPGWVQLNAARELGEIGPGEKREVGISFSPSPDKVSEGMHSFYLRVAASNHETTDIGLYATVSRSGIGNVLFKITDIYTGTFDRANEPIRGLAGAMIEIEAEAGSEVLAADTTNALGEALIAGLAVGRYRYRVTADDHLEYSGVFSIKSGIVVHENIFLESDLVTVSWDLFEVPTQEKYDVRTTTTYRPDAPAAVVVCEPASAKLPLMEPGDVYKGEFTLINKGRIRAYDIRFEPPVDEDLYRFELLEGLPDSLEPGQRFKVPYRATCIRSPFESASGGAGTFPATYYMDAWCMPTIIMPYKYQCMGGGIQCSRAKFIYIQQCWRIAVDVYQYMFMVIEKPRLEPFGRVDIICPREDLCEVQDACCRIGTSEPLEGGGYLNLATGKFTDTVTDLSVKARGGQVGVVRVLSDIGWRFEHIDRLALSYDTYLENQVDVIIKGGTFYTRPRTETIIALTAWDPQVWISVVDPNRKIYRMTNLNSDPDHFLWTEISGEWRKYDLSGKLIAYGDKNGLIASLVYKAGVDGELTGVRDRSGNQVLWYECEGMKVLGVSDASGRRVEYVYAGDRLSAAIYQFGDEVHAVHYNSDGSSYEEVDSEGNSRVFAMNEQGEVTGVTDAVGPGPKISYDYDSQRRMKHTRIEYPSGKIKELWYDNAGHRITAINGKVVEEIIVDGRNKTIIDSHQNKIVKAYDEWGNLTRETYEDGSSVSYEYMPTTAYLTRKTDERGIVTLYGYQLIINLFEFRVDARLNRIIEAAGTPNERITEYGYDEWGNQTTIKVLGDAGTPEAVTVMEYDGFGNMVAVTDPEGNTTRFTHDIQGNVVTRKDGRGKEWTYGYTLAGRLKSAEDPLSNETRMEYDRLGKKVKDIDAEEKATTYKYDARRKLKEITDPLGNSTSYEYNEDGQVATVTDPEGKAIRYDYDVEGRLIYTIDGNGNETIMEYGDGPDSSCTSCGVGSGPKRIIYPTFTREYFYDKRGRKTGEADILNADQIYLTQFFYDGAGNLVAKKDKEERTTAYAYDELNRLAKETDPLDGITEYAYDDRDNLISLKDANGNVTRFEYDKNNRLIKEIRPMRQETTYAYDQVGNLIGKTDAKGQTTTYEYDDAGRAIGTRYYPAGSGSPVKTVAFTYDKVGSLRTYADGATSGEYFYDDAHRKTSERVNYGPFDLGYSYTYYKNGKKKSFTNGEITYDYTYDNANQLKSVLIPGQGSITYNSYTWTRPKTITLPGNSRKEYTYDPLMRIKAITAKDPANHAFMGYNYKYSPMDNVTEKQTERGHDVYVYDELYRLTTVDNPVLSEEAFTYDPVGNRLTDAAIPGAWSYDQNNELLGYETAVCRYDENGNLIQKADGAQVMNFSYDVENRLERVEGDGGSTVASYYYDPFGRRLSKDVAGVKTYFLYADEGLIGEYNAAGTEIRSYGYKPDSTWTTDPLFMKQGGQYYFYHNDHLGTPQQMTASNGAVVWSAMHASFGEAQVDPSSTVMNNLRFPGQYYDDETGLHYNWHRDYDSGVGRYIETDPIGFNSGVNLYIYCIANPLKLFDSVGLWTDGHRDLTERSARSEGFAPQNVAILIRANLDVDRAANAFNNPAHFMPGTFAAATRLIEAQLDRAVLAEKRKQYYAAMESLGTGLHTVQDRWAHYEQNADWREHFDGTDPDNPERHPVEYQRAYEDSVAYIRRFRERICKHAR